MIYTKPEVAVLGEAARVIESIPPTKGPYQVYEFPGPGPRQSSAYDLDE